MAKQKYFWQGEPVKTEFGYCTVHENKDKPLWWYNYYCKEDGYAHLEAVRITTKSGETFCISNIHGYGVHKLINGGWPNYGHAGLPDEGFEMYKTRYPKEFDHEAWSKEEGDRHKWQEVNFPKEFERSENLSRLISNSKISNKDLF